MCALLGLTSDQILQSPIDRKWTAEGLDHPVMHAIHIDAVRLSRHFPLLPASRGTATEHVHRIERVLYIFSKCSSPTGYNQGFHELLLPFYYLAVMGGIQFGLDMQTCEAITYFLIHWLINGTVVGDFFICDLPEPVIGELCQRSFQILRVCDPRLYQTMSDNDVTPVLFAFSWLSVLFAQVYDLPVLLKLWDFLFADLANLRFNLSLLIAAHLMSLRHRFVGKNFGQIMKEFNGLELASEVQAVWYCRRILQTHGNRLGEL
jgi:hypothetical protein